MSRFTNLAFFVLLSTCIYTTFSVKDEVSVLAKNVAVLKGKIRMEKEKIDLYNTELSVLTGASRIDTLKNKLIPELKVISVNQIQLLDQMQISPQLAQNNFK